MHNVISLKIRTTLNMRGGCTAREFGITAAELTGRSRKKVRTLPPAVFHLATRVTVPASTLPGSVPTRRNRFPEGLT